jgi:RNA polymerase-associated protein CTR9
MSQRAREEQARVDAEKLAEERRLAREQALEWTREVRMDSDDEQEREKRPNDRRRQRQMSPAATKVNPRKRREGKIKKSGNEQGEEDQAMFSEEDDAEKPTKKVRNPSRDLYLVFLSFFQRQSKKRVVRDDDDEEAVAHPRKKQ